MAKVAIDSSDTASLLVMPTSSLFFCSLSVQPWCHVSAVLLVQGVSLVRYKAHIAYHGLVLTEYSTSSGSRYSAVMVIWQKATH